MFKRDRISAVRGALEAAAGRARVRTDAGELLAYSYDAGMARAMPEVVINFTDTAHVAPVVKILHGAGIPFLPRLAGTNLSGGTIPLKGGAILNLSALKRIHRIDTKAGLAVVDPGVVNLELQKALEPFGFFYAPDPASQKVSTIGGNIGENAGGPLCLKYGVTADNVEKLEVVTPDGETHTWACGDPGPDLMGLMIGSEGTLGIVTRAWLRILPLPSHLKAASAAFPSLEGAMRAVTRIISSGIVPRALEAMDKVSLDASLGGKSGHFPAGTEAVLILELDGEDPVRIKADLEVSHKICHENGCGFFKVAGDEAERSLLWQARKGAYPALARLAPDVLVEDGVVPRPRLPEALSLTREIISRYRLTAGLLFHAGDGNLHPNVVFDRRDTEQVKRVKKAGYEMLKACIDLGGTISGEHGVGVEKRVAMNWLYGPAELDFFHELKLAFDPAGLANPDKILPVAADRAAAKPRPQGLADTFVFPGKGGLSPEAKDIIDELRMRAASGIKTAVTGLGTRRLPAPRGPAKKLDLTVLSGLIELDRDNLTVRVEAGMPVKKLFMLLREEGLALDLPQMEGTVGGLIASKSCPDVRPLLLGLEVASAEGVLLELGGKTVKNVAGYDAVRLLCGSMGAYAVILSATLALSASRSSDKKQRAEDGRAPDFKPGGMHRRLKERLDPRNLLNPWIYGGALP